MSSQNLKARIKASGIYNMSRQPCARLSRWLVGKTAKCTDTGFNFMDTKNYGARRNRKTQNGHKHSGNERDNGRRGIEHCLKTNGKVITEIQGSKSSRAEANVQDVITVNDLSMPRDSPRIRNSTGFMMIDTDYYVHDWRPLLSYDKVVGMYTFSPIHVAGVDRDSPYTIQDDTVLYSVSGGGNWHHKVWDWRKTGEFITVDEPGRVCNRRGRFLKSLGFRRKHVYKKAVIGIPDTPNRTIVWLLPQWSYMTHKFLPKVMLNEQEPSRLTYSAEGRPSWNFIQYNDGQELMVSLGYKGGQAHVEMPKWQYDILINLPNAGAVSSRMMACHYSAMSVSLFQQYYRNAEYDTNMSVVLGAPYELNPTPFVPQLGVSDDTFPHTWRAIGPPLLEESSMVPLIKEKSSFESSVDFRVLKNVNKLLPPNWLDAYVHEFLECLVPRAGKGIPADWDEAVEDLDKPSQVALIRNILETLGEPPMHMIEGFIKNEPTSKPNRIISSFPDVRYLVAMTRLTLPFREEILHEQPWFMPGKDPKQIAEEVCEYARSIQVPAEGDYSNFDGTVSEWLQENIINAAYLRWLDPRFRQEFQPLLRMLISCPARAKRFNMLYEAGPGIKSGSPTTCDGNTMLNAFLQYVAIRRSDRTTTPRVAFRLIGLAFGDDSLFDDKYKHEWLYVAKKVGMNLKIEPYDVEKGITFLARVYPDPIATTTSFQDPKRTMMKLHLTSRQKTVPLADAATDRLEGYLVTDSMTPIISTYCRKMISHHASEASSLAKRARRHDHNRDKPYWVYGRNDGKAWPQNRDDLDLVIDCMAARLGIDRDHLLAYEDHLMATSYDDIKPLKIGDGELAGKNNIYPTTGTIAPTDNPLVILDHDHKGLPRDGSRHNHAHRCTACDTIFYHSHVIKSVEESKKFLHICKTCRAKRKGPGASVKLNSPHLIKTTALISSDKHGKDDGVELERPAPVTQSAARLPESASNKRPKPKRGPRSAGAQPRGRGQSSASDQLNRSSLHEAESGAANEEANGKRRTNGRNRRNIGRIGDSRVRSVPTLSTNADQPTTGVETSPLDPAKSNGQATRSSHVRGKRKARKRKARPTNA
uniref:RNA replicase n=1 Tax=Beihai noda-like virus 28 TaxID=1922482 RepID=A0A1L3KFG0_9VIRU|nr:hypothetical protein [Beihai noda-like virus 28]